jgi:hypothetical protein
MLLRAHRLPPRPAPWAAQKIRRRDRRARDLVSSASAATAGVQRPDCYRTDPEWMTHVVSDEYREGAVGSETPHCETCRWRPGELAAAYGTRDSAIWCGACAGPTLAALTFRYRVTISPIGEPQHVRRRRGVMSRD